MHPIWDDSSRGQALKPQYLKPIAPGQSWPHSTNYAPWQPSTQAQSSLRKPSDTVSKRKINHNVPGQLFNKKQKAAHEQNISDESFRTAQTPHFGAVQPMGIKTGDIPLSNVERWRLRGWRWQEAIFRLDKTEPADVESPTGTTIPSKA
jgi:hypothetical protein